MKKKNDKTYVYEYPYSKEQFLSKIPKRISYYNEYYIEKNNDMLLVGVERLGHSSGTWYVGHIIESENKTLITGKFVIDPDENGNSRYKKNKRETFGIVVICIFLFPLFLLILIGSLFSWIYRKIAKKTYWTMTNEERLDQVMICHFGCKKE